MKTMLRGLWLGALITLTITACSNKSPTQSAQLRDGTIYFTNSSSYAVRLTNFAQIHEGQLRNQLLNTSIFIGGQCQLHDLFSGSAIFPGGDQVTVGVVSLAPDPHNPNQPLFSENVFFTVNGSAIVKIMNAGQYEISGR